MPITITHHPDANAFLITLHANQVVFVAVTDLMRDIAKGLNTERSIGPRMQSLTPVPRSTVSPKSTHKPEYSRRQVFLIGFLLLF